MFLPLILCSKEYLARLFSQSTDCLKIADILQDNNQLCLRISVGLLFTHSRIIPFFMYEKKKNIIKPGFAMQKPIVLSILHCLQYSQL